MSLDDLLAVDDPTEGTLDELADRYAQARRGANMLDAIANEIEVELAARMETDELPTRGGVMLYRTYTRRSAWRDEHASEILREDLRESVTKKLAVDIATGEIDQAKRNIARAAITMLYEAIPAFSSLKNAGARTLGLRIDDYRTFTDVVKVTIAGALDPEEPK